MYIFIMRHGDAVPSQFNDKDRALSDYGVKQSSQTAAWLLDYCQANNTQLTTAIVSPFKRAQQTLATVRKQITIEQIIENAEFIPSGNKFAAHGFIDSILAGSHAIESVLIVSHMPMVSYLIDEICQSQLSKIMQTASVVCIDYDPEISLGYVVEEFVPD